MGKKSRWSESHPAAYVLIMVMVSAVLAGVAGIGMAAIIDLFAVMIMHGSLDHLKVSNTGLANTAMLLVGYVVVLLLFWLIFRKNLQGFFNTRRFGTTFLLGWSILAAVVYNVIPVILKQDYGDFGTALLMGLQPGIGEEIVFRVIPICLVMRSRNRERLIVPVIIFTSVLFGMVHGFNIYAGADHATTLFQVVYAACIGFLFAVIYLKTGDIWITMLLHTLTDVTGFLGAEEQSGGGVMTQGVNVTDAVFLLVCTVLIFINAFLLFRKTSKAEILDTWSGIWKTETES